MLHGKVIGIIGAGNMAEALVRGLIGSRAVKAGRITVSDLDAKKADRFKRVYRVRAAMNNAEMARTCDILVLAVKPGQLREAARGIASCLSTRQTVVSIAAGIKTSSIERLLRKRIPVVRVMPNTPALIGQGMSVVSRGRYATRKHEQAALELFRAVGNAVPLAEKYMDAVTAVSGSGPAYFFYLLEALAEAGEKAGLPRTISLLLAKETLSGAAQMVIKTGAAPEQLRERVTSKGGTTQAALAVLERKGFKCAVALAVQSAARRSKQLSKMA